MWTNFTSSFCFVRTNVTFTIISTSFFWALQLTALVEKPDSYLPQTSKQGVGASLLSPLPQPSQLCGVCIPQPSRWLYFPLLKGFTFLCWNLSSEFRKFFSDEFLHIQNDLIWTLILKWQNNWSKILVPCLISSRTVGVSPCPAAWTVSLEGLRPAWLVSW